MTPAAPQPDKRKTLRRWLGPVTCSLIANLLVLGYAGHWFGGQDFSAPPLRVLRLERTVALPPIARKPERTPIIQPKREPRDLRPREPKSPTHRPAATARSGARRAPIPVHNLPHVTPHSAAPQTDARNADRDPFAPDVAPAAVIRQPTHAVNTVALPTPPPQTPPPPKPQQIASVSGAGQLRAPVPSPTPIATTTPAIHVATGAAPEAGPPRSGSGGNGTGERGNGTGAGGVLPFGLSGGRGGEGDHHIVYLLDFSPSMRSRLYDLRIEINRSMANLTPDDLFDIFAFGDHVVKMEDYLEPATPDSLAEAREFLNHMNQIDGTNIEEVMLEALNLHHTNEIVLITDGVPEDGETDFDALEREVRLANIHHVRIDTIGLVGVNDYNDAQTTFEAAQLLQALARDSGGSYKLVPLGVDDSD